jgi:hypothetical protein
MKKLIFYYLLFSSFIVAAQTLPKDQRTQNGPKFIMDYNLGINGYLLLPQSSLPGINGATTEREGYIRWNNVLHRLEYFYAGTWQTLSSSGAVAFSSITGLPTTLGGYGITDGVLASRTLTINGTSYDLSQNRSWTITAGGTYNSSLPLSISPTNVISIARASSSQDGYLAATDYQTFAGKQTALGYTPENVANKNVTNGYAGLTNGRLQISQVGANSGVANTYLNGQGNFAQVDLTSGVTNVLPAANGGVPIPQSLLSGQSLRVNGANTGWDAFTAATTSDLAAKQNVISLTTNGTGGGATFTNNVLNIPVYAGKNYTASSPLNIDGNGNFTIQNATSTQTGALTSTDWNTFNNKQPTITLTNNGTTGTATFVNNVLNIPSYVGMAYASGYGLNLNGSTFSADTTALKSKASALADYNVLSNRFNNYVPNTRTLNNGTGISPIGNLSTDRTISVDTTVMAPKAYVNNYLSKSAASTAYVPQTRTVAGFPLTSNVTLATLSSAYGVSSFTYNGASPASVAVDSTVVKSKSSALADYNVLSNRFNSYVPTTRTLTAGTGVLPIGDLSANRTIATDTTVLRTTANSQSLTQLQTRFAAKVNYTDTTAAFANLAHRFQSNTFTGKNNFSYSQTNSLQSSTVNGFEVNSTFTNSNTLQGFNGVNFNSVINSGANVTITNPGSGYTNGTFYGCAITGLTGYYATIIVSGGVVSSIVIDQVGSPAPTLNSNYTSIIQSQQTGTGFTFQFNSAGYQESQLTQKIFNVQKGGVDLISSYTGYLTDNSPMTYLNFNSLPGSNIGQNAQNVQINVGASGTGTLRFNANTNFNAPMSVISTSSFVGAANFGTININTTGNSSTSTATQNGSSYMSWKANLYTGTANAVKYNLTSHLVSTTVNSVGRQAFIVNSSTNTSNTGGIESLSLHDSGNIGINSTTDNTAGILQIGAGNAAKGEIQFATQSTSVTPSATTVGAHWWDGSRMNVVQNATTSQQYSYLNDLNSYQILATSTKTANYSIVLSDYTIRVDCTSAPVSITLPTGTTFTGRVYNIKKIDSSTNAVTIVGTVDGVVNPTITSQYQNKQIQYNGTSWDNL